MPRKSRTQKDQERDDGATASTIWKRVAFVSYQGPHKRTTALEKKLIHQQAMKEIGKARRKHKDKKFVELDLSILRPNKEPGHPPASWWLGVRWTLSDNINMVTSFAVDLDALGNELIANSKLERKHYPKRLPSS